MEVADAFIEDEFNLTGLFGSVSFYKVSHHLASFISAFSWKSIIPYSSYILQEAIDMILDLDPDEDYLHAPNISLVEAAAERLYGLIHQRFILTKAGLEAMVSFNIIVHLTSWS